MPSPHLLTVPWCAQERGLLKSSVHPSGDGPHCHTGGAIQSLGLSLFICKREPPTRARGDAPSPGLGRASYWRGSESVWSSVTSYMTARDRHEDGVLLTHWEQRLSQMSTGSAVPPKRIPRACLFSFVLGNQTLGLENMTGSLSPPFLVFTLSPGDFQWKTLSGCVCLLSKCIDFTKWEPVSQYGFCTQYLPFKYSTPMHRCWAIHLLSACSGRVPLGPSLHS